MAEAVTYNGVNLEIVRTNTIRRVPVFTDDGVDYLYTHWVIDVDAVFNPQATSINALGLPVKGFLPAATDVNIRQLLTAPRKQLIVRNSDAGVILTSPLLTNSCDGNNGPIPSDICSVERIVGTKSFMVHFVVETWVNECPANPIIFAHRWEQEMDVDEDQVSTRTIRGQAVFNGARLLALGTVPDQYRQDLFHPCPAEYQRQDVQVVADSDGNRVDYSIVDRQKTVDFPSGAPPGSTRIECVPSAWFQQAGLAQAAAKGVTNAPLTGLMGAGAGSLIGGMIPGVGVLGGWAIGAAIGGGTIGSIFPRYHYACTTRVWGNRNAVRGGPLAAVNHLQAVAVGVTLSRLKFDPRWTMNEMQLTHDAAGKMVEFTMQASHGIEGGGLAGIQQGLNDIFSLNTEAFARRFFADFVQDEFLRIGAGPGGTPTSNPRFGGAGQQRGTSLESIFAQAFSQPCDIPPRPFNQQKTDKTFRVP